jgi:6-phosphogluconolactonase (cycloisomerase 2 family)
MQTRHFTANERTWLLIAENFKDEITVWEWDKESGVLHKVPTNMHVPFVSAVDVAIVSKFLMKSIE